MKRSSFRLADYNPRTIDDYARAELEKSLRRFGLVEPPLVNTNTSNLVGGHQRLSIWDQIQGYDGTKKTDYELDVSLVKLTPARERELNIALNNANLQGSYDVDKLRALLEDTEIVIDVDRTGFTAIDLEEFGLGITGQVDELADSVSAELGEIAGEAKAIKAPEKTSAEIAKERRAEMRQEHKEGDDVDGIYTVVVFRSREEAERFAEHLGHPRNAKYVDGVRLFQKLGLEAPKTESAA